MSDFMIPIPDAIRDDDTGKDRSFLFSPGPANINIKERTMTAPVTLSERTRLIQLRELAHAKWSPANIHVGGIDQNVLEAVEHSRLNHQLLNAGFKLKTARLYADEDIDYVIQRGDVVQAAKMFIETINTSDGALVKQKFDKKYGTLSNQIRHALGHFNLERGHRPDWSSSFTWDECTTFAKEVQKVLRDYIKNKEELENQPPPPPSPQQPREEEIAASIIRDVQKDTGGKFWAPMPIVEPPRTIPQPVDLKARKTIKSDTGAVPIAIHRAMIDGRVFRAKRRIPASGAVLIDQSGSMSLDYEDVERVMEHLPGVVIAGYSTDGGKGQLRIIARNGKRVKTEDLMAPGGGNGCDGPALRWLEQQPGPRFWVSDGYATALVRQGAKMESLVTPDLRREMVESQVRGRILRVENCADLTLRLARKAARA